MNFSGRQRTGQIHSCDLLSSQAQRQLMGDVGITGYSVQTLRWLVQQFLHIRSCDTLILDDLHVYYADLKLAARMSITRGADV